MQPREAIRQLADLEVTVSVLTDGETRVELVDRRQLTEVVSLTPDDAAALGERLSAGATAAGFKPPRAAQATRRRPL